MATARSRAQTRPSSTTHRPARSTRAAPARRPRGASFQGVPWNAAPAPAAAPAAIPDDLDALPQAADPYAGYWAAAAAHQAQAAPAPEPTAHGGPSPRRLLGGLVIGSFVIWGLVLLVIRTLAGFAPTAPAPAPTEAVAEAPQPATLAFPTPAPVWGWWAPDGEPVALGQPQIVGLVGRCGARVDIVQVQLLDGPAVWMAAADAYVDAASVAAAPDVCGGGL